MFFFRKLFGLLFLGLLLMGALGFFSHMGQNRTQAAYQQGFLAGQQAAASSGAEVPTAAESAPPAAPKGYPGANVYYRGHGFFFPGFGLLFCLLPFFVLGFLFIVFDKRRRHGHRHWPGHRHYRHGPCGPGPWKRHPGESHQDWPGGMREKSPDDIDDGPDEPIMRT